MCIHTLPFLFIEGKEGNVLLNDALNTFYLRLYGGNIVNNHSDSERGNPLPLRHGLLFPISSKESYIHHPTVRRSALAKTRNSSMGPP